MMPFNRSQRLGLNLDQHIALDAGAGTGKTTVMAERYVQHLLSSEQRATCVLPSPLRNEPYGAGRVKAAKKDRTPLNEWKGLLPQEIVAITFTRKAAAELRSRIRSRIQSLRAEPVKKTDRLGIHDPRLRHQGDVSMLMSLLEAAPISTIDSFLGEVLAPHIDLVALHLSRDQLPDEQAPLLRTQALNAAWRIRNARDGFEAGLTQSCEEFIEARNRLAIRLGGQSSAQTVLTGLLESSLFVEESKRRLRVRSIRNELPWDGSSPPDYRLIEDMILERCGDLIDGVVEDAYEYLNQWVEVFTKDGRHAFLVNPSGAPNENTRFNQLSQLAREPLPTTPISRLQWIHQVIVSLCSPGQVEKSTPTILNSGGFHSQTIGGWHSGLVKWSSVSFSGITQKESKAITKGIQNEAKVAATLLRNRFHNPEDGRLLLMLSRASYALNPLRDFDFRDANEKYDVTGLNTSPCRDPPEGNLRVSSDLQVEVLDDLYTVHAGCQDLLRHLKAQEEAHDFDDVQLMVGDLLLVRCPEIVRHWYPPQAVQALDDLGEEAWTDEHIRRALSLMQGDEEKQNDLRRRYSLLQQIRARYGAFIIDEYQDTNPEHARLLARLWGHRIDGSDETPNPLGPWDPTVCIVGDMKQSIYRFRQAEVTVMRRMVASIRLANRLEEHEPRMEHLIQQGHGRDPRPVGAGGETGSFIQASEISSDESSATWDYVSFGINDFGTAIDDPVIHQRQEGHIELTTNFRTAPRLLNTLNHIFDDTFSERHHQFPGEFHATAQPLHAGRETDRDGVIEWLLPTQTEIDALPLDLGTGYHLFDSESANPRHLEHELIAARLDSLVRGYATRLWSTEEQEYVDIEPEDVISPEDVMILVHSRKHIPDLIKRLQSRGLPVLADKQGQLLQQPVVKPLLSVLSLLAKPSSRLAAHGLVRSPIVGATSVQIEEIFEEKDVENYWNHISAYFGETLIGDLMSLLSQLIGKGALHEIFDAVLDYSDLLTTYPDESERQVAETWCALLYKIGTECGHEPSAMLAKMNALASLENKGPQATSSPTSGAIQIMTIHGAKGLQAPVVIVTGLFEAGRRSSSNDAQKNVLITPDVIAGRIQPWKSKDKPLDGLWMLANQMNKAQNLAELRRQFYVALTRVRDRLIFVGSPSKTSTMSSDGFILATGNISGNNMGDLLLDGLRYMGVNSNVEQPWSLEGDTPEERLSDYASIELILDPLSVFTSSGFPSDSLQEARIYHHPNCFTQQTPISVLNEWLEMESRLDYDLDQASENEVVTISPSFKMTAHGLDAANSCRRRFWLNHVRGWQTEPFNIEYIARMNPSDEELKDRTGGEDYDGEAYVGWPSATSFGSMFHRLVEIGLANPATMKSKEFPLSSEWLNGQENRLLETKEIDDAITSEPEWHKLSYDEQQQTRKRIIELAQLLSDGLLGKLTDGEEVNGQSIEGLQTEASFYFTKDVELNDVYSNPTSGLSQTIVTQIENVAIIFEGQADIVLAGCEGADKWLQVGDLKTSGSRTDDLSEHPLQQEIGDWNSSTPQNAEEIEMLRNHRLQLTLYSMVFDKQESFKPADQRRRVKPPALLISTSGRLVQMPIEMYEEAQNELSTLLEWIAKLTANRDGVSEPKRLPMDSIDTCKKCPFFKGELRMCGPDGVDLGIDV